MVDRARGAPHSRSSDPRRADSPAAGRPRAPEHRIAQLQRQVGNRVVTEYVRALNVQRVKEGDGPTNDIGIIQQQLNHVGAKPQLANTGRYDTAPPPTTTAIQ